MRASFPDAQEGLRERLRRSAFSRPIRAPICISRRACPTTPASTCRACPPTPISASTSTATARSAIMRHLPDKETAYFRFLPMYYPYVIKKAPKTFITQFGGGISTEVALRSGAKDVTVAEGNRAVLEAFHEPGDPRLHRRHPLARSGSSTTRAATSSPQTEREIRRHRPEPRRFGRPLQSRRLRHRGEVRLHAGGDGNLHARARRRRRAVGDDLEQGRAAEIGAQALRDDGGGRARDVDGDHIAEFVLRRLVLPLDRDRALQARRLHAPTRSPSCASTRTTCRSTRSIRRACSTTARRPTARSTAMSRRFFSGAADGPPAPTAADAAAPIRPAADPTAPGDAGRRAASRRRRAARDRDGPARLACADQRRLARHRRSATCSTPASSPTTRPISPPT